MAARKRHLDPQGLVGIDRRNFLKYAAAVSAAAGITAALSACSSPSGQPTPASSGSPESSSGSPTSSSATSGGVEKPEGHIDCSLAFALASGFDPMSASDAVATCVNQHIFEALVDLDPVTRKPYLALAAAEPTSSADGLTWTVAIREGAKFSDGTDVTAEDVAWSFMRCIDPANDALMAGFVPFLDSASATDPKTVEFKLKEPFSLFPERISVIKIVPKAKTTDAAASKAFDSAPIGTGPFKIDSVNETTGVVVSFNENYNGPRPARVATVNFRTTQDNQARLNDLRGGHRRGQRRGVGHADVLGGVHHQPARDEPRILPCLDHPGQIVHRGIDIRPADRLDECADHVVVLVTGSVVAHGGAVHGRFHGGQADGDRVGAAGCPDRIGGGLQRGECPPCIAACQRDDVRRRLGRKREPAVQATLIAQQQYPPDELIGVDYYEPTARGAERAVAERLPKLRRAVRGE